MSLFRLENCSVKDRMAQLRERLSDPLVRDRVINVALGLGLALVAGLSTYMLLYGR